MCEEYNFRSYDEKVVFSINSELEYEIVHDIFLALDDFICLYNSQRNFKMKSKYSLFLGNLEYYENPKAYSNYLKTKLEEVIKGKDFDGLEYKKIKDIVVLGLIDSINKDFDSCMNSYIK